jgi:hypothetical protein
MREAVLFSVHPAAAVRVAGVVDAHAASVTVAQSKKVLNMAALLAGLNLWRRRFTR